jgi:hypothetical protein
LRPERAISSAEITGKFAEKVSDWTGYSLMVATVVKFSKLQHDVHKRGGFPVWELENQPKRHF